MISYLRTTKRGAEMALNAFQGLEVMVERSLRTKTILSVLPYEYKIIYNLDWNEMYTELKMTESTHVVIIKSSELQDAQIRALVNGIEIPWQHIKFGLSRWLECYAYENGKGDICFKLPLMKKERRFAATEIKESYGD